MVMVMVMVMAMVKEYFAIKIRGNVYGYGKG